MTVHQASTEAKIEVPPDREGPSVAAELGPGEGLTGSSPLATLLLVGMGSFEKVELRQSLGEDYRLLFEETLDGALRRLATQERAAVLCLGSDLEGDAAEAALRQLDEQAPDGGRLYVVLAGGDDLQRFQDWVENGTLFYLSRQALGRQALVEILVSAVQRQQARGPTAARDENSARGQSKALRSSQALTAEKTLDRFEVLTRKAAEELLDARSAQLLFHDPETEALWSPSRGEDEQDSTAAGLLGFVARTGASITIPDVDRDPRHEAEVDNPEGAPGDRLLAVRVPWPRLTETPHDSVLAVLSVARSKDDEPFTNRDLELASFFARQIAPRALVLLSESRSELSKADQLFRREAIDHHRRGLQEHGDILRISPGWIHSIYWLLLFLLACSFLYGVFGTTHQYASGPAIVRAEGRTEITASFPGTVTAVDVRAGDAVVAGQQLLTFYSAQEAAQLERIQHEIRLQLSNRLRNPSDTATERSLISLQAQREQAEAQLAERTIFAPADAVISDVRVRAGRPVQPGQVLLSLRQKDADLGLVVLLPGHFLPQVQAGMPLRLEFEGYQYAYQTLTVESVSEEVIGPTEAQRLLGPHSDTVLVEGPVVFAYARLESHQFESNRQVYDLHDGMSGIAEVRVQKERVIFTLIPSLKAVFAND